MKAKTLDNEPNSKDQNPKTFQTVYWLGIKWEKENMFIQKKKKRENGKFPGTGSPS